MIKIFVNRWLRTSFSQYILTSIDGHEIASIIFYSDKISWYINEDLAGVGIRLHEVRALVVDKLIEIGYVSIDPEEEYKYKNLL